MRYDKCKDLSITYDQCKDLFITFTIKQRKRHLLINMIVVADAWRATFLDSITAFNMLVCVFNTNMAITNDETKLRTFFDMTII